MNNRWLRRVAMGVAMLLCATLAAWTACRIVRDQYRKQFVDDLTRQMTSQINVLLRRLEEPVDGAFMLLLYALENHLLEDPAGAPKLNRYAIYTTLRYAQRYSEYFNRMILYDEQSNLIYDSSATVVPVGEYYDPGIQEITSLNKSRIDNPIGVLAYYTHSTPQRYDQQRIDRFLTAVLSLRQGVHALLNIDIDRYSAHLEATVRELIPCQAVLLTQARTTVFGLGNREIPSGLLSELADGPDRPDWMTVEGQNYLVFRQQSVQLEIEALVLVSEQEIDRQTSASIRSVLFVQILLFAVYTLIFASLWLGIMRPIIRLLRENLSATDGANTEKQPVLASPSVKEMLVSVLDQNRKLHRLQEDLYPALVSNLLAELLSSPASATQKILDELARYNVTFTAGPYYACALEIHAPPSNRGSEEMVLRKRLIVKWCNDVLVEHGGFAVDMPDHVVGIVASAAGGHEHFASLIGNLQKRLFARFEKNMVIAMGCDAAAIRDIGASFERVQDALEYRIAFGDNEIIDCCKITGKSSELARAWQDIQPELKGAILLGDADQAERLLGRLFDLIAEHRYATDNREIAEVALSIVQMTQMILQRESYDPSLTGKVMMDVYQGISWSTRSVLHEQLHRLVVTAACQFSVNDTKHDSRQIRTIRKASAYIDAHFTEDISLDMLADRVGINASYLSTLFKEVTGTSFLTYLENRRMEEATRLIREGILRVGQIAEATGYNSANYFSKVFRKKMGLSPEQYRDLIRNGKDEPTPTDWPA